MYLTASLEPAPTADRTSRRRKPYFLKTVVVKGTTIPVRFRLIHEVLLFSVGIVGAACAPAVMILPTPAPPTAEPLPSPEVSVSGGQLAFSAFRMGEAHIYLMNPDGTGLLALTQGMDRDHEPTWSPDGSRLAFVRTLMDSPSNLEIFVIQPDGTGLRQLTDHAMIDTQPDWSPDGTQLVFVSNRDSYVERRGPNIRNVSVFEIYTMNADGSGVRRLTRTLGWNSMPVWSPDGSLIAFVTSQTGNDEIFVMNPDGTGGRNLTQQSAQDAAPAWSPDGTRLAFHSRRDGDFEIYVMNADGSAQTRLTRSPGWDIHPTWSPDGSWIAFYSERSGNFDVYIMRADGSEIRQLTTHPDFDGHPAWRP